MGFTEKIDALDLVINVLWEHEREFDALIARLEQLLDRMEDG